MNGDSKNYTHYYTDSTVKGILGKKLHHNRWTISWTLCSESLIGLTSQSV